MIIYHNAFKGVFQYILYPYVRIGQNIRCFIIEIKVAHADVLLSASPLSES